MSLFKSQIIGNLGSDPRTGTFERDGETKNVTNFSVATTSGYGDKAKTTWVKVAVFDYQADACATYLKKGSKVYVEGFMKSDPETGGPPMWTDKDGNLRASFELISKSVIFMSKAGDGGSDSGEDSGDDLPV